MRKQIGITKRKVKSPTFDDFRMVRYFAMQYFEWQEEPFDKEEAESRAKDKKHMKAFEDWLERKFNCKFNARATERD